MPYNKVTLFDNEKVDYLVLLDHSPSVADIELAKTNSFIPDWSSFSGIKILAPFTKDLVSTYITGLTSNVVGYSIYRQKNGESFLHKVADVDESTLSIIDYLTANRNEYKWTVVPVTEEEVGVSFASEYMMQTSSNLNIFSLVALQDNLYTISESWSFSLGADQPINISGLTQNIDSTQIKTLSRYPKTVRGASNYVSGNATFLLGYIDENTGRYVETPEMLDQWLDFVFAGGPYLLKDPFGKLFICDITDSTYQPDYDHSPTRTVINISFTENTDSASVSVYQ